MKKYVLLILLALFLSACTSGKTEFFPTRGETTDAAEVTVIRQKSGFGLGFSMQVLLDGKVIARLKSGQYATFFVDPGVHKIGVKKSTITVMLDSENKHYFLIKADSSQFGFEIERISEKKATARMAKSRSIN
jgi:PBP1b-binding outer membrane lipoprotein LpoB